MWFELCLLKKGLVTIDQLLEAVERQRLSRIPLGRLAVLSRKMTIAQVFEVLKIQADILKPFGRVAVEKGYLSDADLAHLLMLQDDQTRPIDEILIEMGAISREQLMSERRHFQASMVSSAHCCAPDEVLC